MKHATHLALRYLLNLGIFAACVASGALLATIAALLLAGAA